MSLMEAMAKLFRAPVRRQPRQARRGRPVLEALEERAAPALDVWIGSSSANWSDGANWSLGQPPNSGDSVYFNNSANCTINVNASVVDFDCTGYSGQITVAANVTVSAALVEHYGTLNLLAGSTINAGSFASGGFIDAQSTNSTINATNFDILSGGSILVQQGGGTPGLTINGAAAYGGPVAVAGRLDLTGSLHQIDDTMTVTGTVNVTGGGDLTVGGTLALSGGTVDVSASFTGNLDIVAGTLLTQGADTIIGNLTNSGTITFGGSVHGLDVFGNYDQFLGTLEMRIGSISGFPIKDTLLITGVGSLGGTLQVSNSLGGPLTQSPIVLIIAFGFGELTGDFTDTSLPTPDPGFFWGTSNTGGSYIIQLIQD